MAYKSSKKSSTGVKIASLIGGAVGGRILGTQISNLLPTSIPKGFANVAPILLGVYLLTNKNEAAQAAGGGMIAGAGSRFLGELIPAIGRAPLTRGAQAILRNSRMGVPANQAILQGRRGSYMGVPANQAILQGGYSSTGSEPNLRMF